jgi:drug/metabolite transporter (DMT)-like permease
VADKFLLSKKIHSSIAYAFFVGIWSIFNFVLLFLDPWKPSLREFAIDCLAGVLFLVTLVIWYKALHQSEATRVVPIVGALVPIFSFLLSYIFFGTILGERELLAFIILIIGGIFISIKHTRFYVFKEVTEKFRKIFGDALGPLKVEFRPTRRLIFNSLASALFFASYYVLMKYVYSTQPFIGAFVWSRFGSFIGVIFILFVPEWRKKIIEQQKGNKSPKKLSFFLSVRLLAALAFIMLNWAISMGSVAIVNALQGVQYIFLILMVLFLSKRFPKLMQEEMGGGVMLQKTMGALLVCIGLYMLINS